MARRSVPVMTGLGIAFTGKMPPEFLKSIVDNEMQAEMLREKMIRKEVSKLPPLNKMPKEVQKAFKNIRKQNGNS